MIIFFQYRINIKHLSSLLITKSFDGLTNTYGSVTEDSELAIVYKAITTPSLFKKI